MQNFWEISGWEASDPHLKRLASMPFYREFPFIPKEKGLYIVRGPRQVGKSSWLKTILKSYSNHTPCFYLSCENVSDYKELSEVLKALRTCKVVLLDEVNFVQGWDRAVKHEVDSGYTHILVVTGSHAYDLKQGADRMPGRFEGGGEFELLPMGFDEFERARKQAGWHSNNRLQELSHYFRVGGFPTAVQEAGPEGKRPTKSMAMYLKWLIGDATKLGKDEGYLKEILIQLARIMQTPVSHQTLAKKTRMGSHNTVQEYLSVLESCFALRILYAQDLDSGAFRFKKDKKFYFVDPLLYWGVLDLMSDTIPKNYEEKLAEMVANEALFRRYKRFGYFNGPSGEIDFVNRKKWALEVKWAPAPLNLSKAYKSLAFGEKIVWSHSNYLVDFPRN